MNYSCKDKRSEGKEVSSNVQVNYKIVHLKGRFFFSGKDVGRPWLVKNRPIRIVPLCRYGLGFLLEASVSGWKPAAGNLLADFGTLMGIGVFLRMNLFAWGLVPDNL